MEPFNPTIDEISDGIFRISTFVPEVGPTGFTFNQFLVRGDESLLFHTGPRMMYPLVAEAVASLVPVETLRYVSFGHVEADECGSMNLWLQASPTCEVAFNQLGVDVSLNDLCDRAPKVVEDGQVLDLGGKRLRTIQTPHVPHGWEAQVMFEETTDTLLCGDLFTQVGAPVALTTEDVVDPAIVAEEIFHATAMAPQTSATMRALGDLEPSTLAIMHGSSFQGDGRKALHALADAYDAMVAVNA